MKKMIVRKLKSRQGASLTYALLLFMVCAVVGSVVLSAATAASGRVSQLAKTDQKYYSVNSAAEFLEDLFCIDKDNPVTVEIKKETSSTVEKTYQPDTWELLSENTTPGEVKYQMNVLKPDGLDSLVRAVAMFYLSGNTADPASDAEIAQIWDQTKDLKDKLQSDMNEKRSFTSGEKSFPAMQISVTADGTDLNVYVVPTIYNNGTVVMEISDKAPDTSGDGTDKDMHYKLWLTLSCQTDIDYAKRETSGQLQVDGTKESHEETCVETYTVKMIWSVAGARMA